MNTNLIRQLYAYVSSGMEAEALDLIAQEQQRLCTQGKFNEQTLMQLFFIIRAALCRVATEVLHVSPESVLPDYRPQLTAEELFAKLRAATRTLCDMVHQRKRSNNQKLREAIIAYLQEHYCDSELTLFSVACAFSVSENYLSTFLKEQTGHTFSAYVENLRMNQARSLLLETNHSIATICSMVGYSNLDTFYKCFKKNFGVPPGTWKKSQRSSL